MNLPKHMPALDGLRGVAILMVVITHVAGGWPSALSIFPGNPDHAATLALPDWLSAITGSASHGVALFFVVSAFTLTVRAARDGGELRSYALRRLARIGPGYWIAGVAYTLIAGLAPRMWAPDGISPVDLLIAAVFGSAWNGGASLAVVPGGWSISCEVSFYIALPAITRLIDGRIWRSLGLTGLAFVIAQLYARYAIVHHLPYFVNPLEHYPVFFCGVTAALIAMRLKLPHLPAGSVLLLVLAVVALPFVPIPHFYLLSHLVFAPVVAVAVALAAVRAPDLLANRLMRRVGEVSYSIYLVHFAILPASLRVAEFLAPALDVRTMLLHFAFTLGASFALALITHRYVEMPAVRWASRRSTLRADRSLLPV